MYDTIVIPFQEDLLQADLSRKIEQGFPLTKMGNKKISISFPEGYEIRFYFEEGDDVMIENREIAFLHPDKNVQEGILRSGWRSSIAGDDDPEMNHFDNYTEVCESLAELDGLCFFDMGSSEFIEFS